MKNHINDGPVFAVAWSVLIISLSAFAIYHDEKHPITCDEYAVVEKILALDGRWGTIQLDDGTAVRVNQATLKPGDKFCKKWSKK